MTSELRRFPWARLVLGVGLLLGLGAGTVRADLPEFVKKPEPKFEWKLKEKKEVLDGTVYDLQMTSQVWHDITWTHQLQVYQPKEVDPNATMLVYVTGGKAKPDMVLFGMFLAQKVKAPVAILYDIPNQPLLGDKKEDTLIAETFVRCLEEKDETWPLLFPMVKSVVKAMDALEAFAKDEWKQPLKGFIVAGASKRGWTSWLTGAVDSRVVAIAPLVIDTLNMQVQMAHQMESFGAYSDQIRDYTMRGLVPLPKTPEAKHLWEMVDPYSYRDKLKQPKLIINGNNDPYWTTDALNLYWDELKGDKYIVYVPNAGHNLEQAGVPLLEKRSRAVNALAAFVRCQMTGKAMPKLAWKNTDEGDQLRLVVTADPAPKGARLWMATAPTRDFREAKWTDQKVKLAKNTIAGEVTAPKEGCLAFYVDLDYEIDGISYHLCSQLRLVGTPKEIKDEKKD
jgi:PhoPQ-activated pathogenicity-related protein